MAVGFSNTNKPINPRGQDASPKGYNKAELFSGKALDFDGVNDNISIPLFNFTAGNKYSLCIYANRDNNGMIWSHSNQFVEIRFNSGTLQLRTYDTAWNTYTLIDDVPANEWHQIVVTYDVDANIWKSYLNGQFIKSVTAAAALYPRVNRIGSSASTFYDGEFANAKIFEVELTAAQVADLYNNPEKIVPTGVDNDALKLWLPMQEGAGTTCINGAPDAIGSELVTNGTFATDSNWTKEGSWTISGGQASISSSTNDRIYQSVSLDANKKYLLSINVTSISTASIRFRFGGNGSASNLSEITTPGIYNFISAPLSGTSSVGIFAVSGASATIDDISVKEISNNGTISGATWTHGIGAPVAQTSVIDWNKHTLDGTNEVLIPQGLTSGRDLLGNLFENVRKQGALNLDGNSWAEVHDNSSLDVTDWRSRLSVGCIIPMRTAGVVEHIIGKWGASSGSWLRMFIPQLQIP